MLWVQRALTGVAAGSVFSLAAMGLVLTYRATGVFNFAHGVVSVFVAYTFWQFRVDWGWPLLLAAPMAIVVVGPAVGLLLERAVFRPLQRNGASTTEKLVATVGVFILLYGVVITVWTATVRQPATLVSRESVEIVSGLRLGYDQIVSIVLTIVATAAVWFLFRRTHLGTEIRAVVDRRLLAEQSGVNANRVAALSWALGTGFAGLAGVLITSVLGSLDPFFMVLFLFDTFAVAVMARLTSVSLAVLTGTFVLGMGQALLKPVELFGGDNLAGQTWAELKPRIPVLLLFGALLVYRKLDVVGEEMSSPRRETGGHRMHIPTWVPVVGAGFVLLVLPGFLGDINMLYATRMLPMAIIFVSIVAVTGFSGHITLGQAALAGFGAFVSARIANSWGVPIALSTLLGGVGAVALGMVAGFPALRRRGLFLGLTTLALGLLVDRLVFQSPVFAGGINGLVVVRPSFFGISLENDNAFYYYELVWLAAMLLLARNLRSGRLGRALAAMRDSEAGSRSVGIDLRNYKLFIFGASAFIAGIGGALLSQQGRQFQYLAFNPVNSLVWFMVVVVVGVQSIFGAVLGAFLFVMLNVVVKVDGLAELLIGLAALSLGRLPGGSVLGVGRWALERGWIGLERAYLAARARPAADPEAPLPYDPNLRRTMALGMGNGHHGDGEQRYAASPLARDVLAARGVTWKPPSSPPPPEPAGPRFRPSPLGRRLRGGGR